MKQLNFLLLFVFIALIAVNGAKKRRERPPEVTIPQNFKLKVMMKEPQPLGIGLDLYSAKLQAKLHLYGGEMGDIEDFNLLDLKEVRNTNENVRGKLISDLENYAE